MTRRLAPPAASVLLVAGLVLGLLAACSDDGGGTSDDDPSVSPSPSGATGTAGTTEAVEPYLPVPTSVELTAPGSDLGVGESAVIAWQPRQDLVGVLDVDVSRLERTSFKESFEGWDVKAEAKQKLTPYFVRATVVNRGETNLSGRLVPLYAVDSGETLVEATKFTEEFRPCPGGTLPKGFSAGDRVDVCLVYLIAPGQELTGVTFRPNADFDPITWTGKVQRLQRSDEDKKKKQDDRGDTGG